MNINKLTQELITMKSVCEMISDSECINKCCPFHGIDSQCMFQDMNMNMPCDWQLPSEVK